MLGENKSDLIEKENTSHSNNLIDFITGIFQPIIAILAGAGLLKGFAALCLVFGLKNTSGFYQILQASGDGIFQFLPTTLAITSARKFKSNEFVALVIAAAMLYPKLVAPETVKPLMILFKGSIIESKVYMTYLGVPVILQSYYSTIVPVIVAVWFGSKVEKSLTRILPDVVKLALVPALTLFITVPVTLLVIGPLSTWAADGLAGLVSAIININSVLAYAIIDGFWQIMVMFSLHWGLIPIMYQNYASKGFDTVLMVALGASFAQNRCSFSSYSSN
ncbi:PTS transporter subunit EIIC [Streptococcus hongkongensis]